MADNIGRVDPPSEQKKNPFDEQKEKALGVLLDRSLQFVDWDIRINSLVEDLFTTINGEVKKNPGVLFSTKGENLDSLIELLKKKPQSGRGDAGLSGGDIVGGAGFGDIIDFIGKIGELAAEEKKFFLKIIFLIFCDCDCVCKCLCD